MIDLHSHILPFVDDGAEDMSVSLDMARAYVACGYTKVVATPHWFGLSSKDSGYNQLRLAELQDSLSAEGIPLEVELGNEVMLTPEALREVQEGRALALAGSQCMLFELPMWQPSLMTNDFIFDMQVKGYIPLLAHPERYSYLAENSEALSSLAETEALFQLNLTSLSGQFGKDVRNFAISLLKSNLVYLVSTDAHGVRKRSPSVERELDMLRELVGEEQADLMTRVRPAALLNNQVLSRGEWELPNTKKKKAGILSGIFGFHKS